MPVTFITILYINKKNLHSPPAHNHNSIYMFNIITDVATSLYCNLFYICLMIFANFNFILGYSRKLVSILYISACQIYTHKFIPSKARHLSILSGPSPLEKIHTYVIRFLTSENPIHHLILLTWVTVMILPPKSYFLFNISPALVVSYALVCVHPDNINIQICRISRLIHPTWGQP